MTTFKIHALPAGEVDTGTELAHRQLASDREPCRRCLRDATPGEPLVLASYDPFTTRSPYAGEGPVFVHAEGCEPFAPEPGAVSVQVGGRQLSVRAYDHDAMMTGAAVLPGERFPDAVAELLGDPDVAFLHVHFAGPGCFAFRVDPA
jgi:hypothetical protein